MVGMMTKEATKPVMVAWCDGKTIQCRADKDCEWQDARTDYLYFDPNLQWRVKPEKKLRPWKPEEVPVGCLIRHPESGFGRWLVTGASGDAIFFALADIEQMKYDNACLNYEHSVDGGKTWTACGVEE